MQNRTVRFETLGTILQEPYMAVTEWGALLVLPGPALSYRGGRDLDGVDKTKEVTSLEMNAHPDNPDPSTGLLLVTL
jgi:hypothetical protein